MAHDIIQSKLVFVLGRTISIPTDATFLDVPKDYNDRWGIEASISEEE